VIPITPREQRDIRWLTTTRYFSEVIPNLTDEETQWMQQQIEPGLEDSGVSHQFETDSEPDGWGRYLWLHADVSADLEQVASFVQRFLRQFRPDRYWSLTFACTCSKPRVGAFSGGAAFVTANDIKWQGSHAFIEAETKAFSGTRSGSHVSRLVQRAGQIVLEDDALDQIVNDVASEHAASVNNQGLVGQIEYLVAELGADETEQVLNDLVGRRSGTTTN
jgi:hypothetical protein